jgi:hypothetical protein
MSYMLAMPLPPPHSRRRRRIYTPPFLMSTMQYHPQARVVDGRPHNLC